MSLTAVAHEAQTTRQALYRRWPTKASLAAATLHAAVDAGPDGPSEDPLADLANFQRGVSQPGRLSLVGTMLQDNTAPEVLARYRLRSSSPAAAASAPSSTGHSASPHRPRRRHRRGRHTRHRLLVRPRPRRTVSTTELASPHRRTRLARRRRHTPTNTNPQLRAAPLNDHSAGHMLAGCS